MFTNDNFLPFDPLSASLTDYERLLQFKNLMLAERVPDDLPYQLAPLMGNYQNIPDFVRYRMIAVWTADLSETVAFAEGYILVNMDENQHVLDYQIEVLPEHRCQGLGRALLTHMASFARETGRTLFLGWTNSTSPAGDIAMERIGAEVGLEMVTNRLDINELDRGLIQDWLKASPQPSSGFTLGLWDGPIPEEALERYVMIDHVMNTAPKGTLEIDDFNITPEQVRQGEKNLAASGDVRWLMYIRHNETGELVGFTEVYYDPTRPNRLGQGATGVLPDYRNHGLGRWLKAAMMDKVLRELPDVRYVYTGNANINAAMLKINNQMGFKPYKTSKSWQVKVDRVVEYLEKRAAVAV